MKKTSKNVSKNTSKKIYFKMLIFIVAIYISIILFNQQKTLNEYTADSVYINNQIKEAEQYSQNLTNQKEQVDSLEFIEKTAREKLDMYYPYETVYVDIGK